MLKWTSSSSSFVSVKVERFCLVSITCLYYESWQLLMRDTRVRASQENNLYFHPPPWSHLGGVHRRITSTQMSSSAPLRHLRQSQHTTFSLLVLVTLRPRKVLILKGLCRVRARSQGNVCKTCFLSDEGIFGSGRSVNLRLWSFCRRTPKKSMNESQKYSDRVLFKKKASLFIVFGVESSAYQIFMFSQNMQQLVTQWVLHQRLPSTIITAPRFAGNIGGVSNDLQTTEHGCDWPML